MSADGENVEAANSDNVEAASCGLSSKNKRLQAASDFLFQAFDRSEPIENLSGNLPHWRQTGRTYFVTFRTADSLPQEKLDQWRMEHSAWQKGHPRPHGVAERREYLERFPLRLQRWLDQGFGACVLARPELREIVESALRYFHEKRYQLGPCVVSLNHVHALVTPLDKHDLSTILHSWKSFTANAINRRLAQSGVFWQKESFDHIVRNEASFEKFRNYIQEHPNCRSTDA